MDISWIRDALADRRLSVVSERTNISIPTLRSIRDGDGHHSTATIEKLALYFSGTAA